MISGLQARTGRDARGYPLPLLGKISTWGGPVRDPVPAAHQGQQRRQTLAAARVNMALYQPEVLQRRQQAAPRDWPPMQTRSQAEALLQAQYNLRYLPMRVELPPHNSMPAAGQEFTRMNQSNLTQAAVGSDLIVVSFQVPPSRNGVIHKISNQSTVGQDGNGQFSWRIDINGATYEGFRNILASIGTMSNPADYDNDPIRIFENELVQLIQTNVSFLGGPGIVQGMLRGYFYPVALEREAVAF